MKILTGNKTPFTLIAIGMAFMLGLFCTNCRKIEPERQIMVKTGTAQEISYTSCKISATLLDVGVSGVDEHGFCWSLSPDPEDAIGCTNLGRAEKGKEFEEVLVDLQPGTSYYVWAYASGDEMVRGKPVSFETAATQVPSVETGVVASISYNTAQCGGIITSDGGSQVTAKGVCWSTSPQPDLDDPHTSDGTGTGEYSSEINGLEPNTTYYVRAYATNSMGPNFGNERTFKTEVEPTPPELTTKSVDNVTWNSATGGGNITSDGGSPVTAKGVCWSTSPFPDLSDPHTSDGPGTGVFNSALTDLLPETNYYARAYATNEVDTKYGDQVEFTTLPGPVKPQLTTYPIVNFTWNSATGGGNITSDGGSPVTARGVCWSTSQAPDLSDPHTSDGPGTGAFISDLTDLQPETMYYARAYATNEVDTEYGNEVTFTTGVQPGVAEVITYDAQEITWTTALSGGNVTYDGGSEVTERGLCWGINPNPTKADFSAASEAGTGEFWVSMSDLLPGTQYHIRAYAINSIDIAYGDDVVFSTQPVVEPDVITGALALVKINSATVNGSSISSEGGAPIISKGLCWGTNPNPTLADSWLEYGTGPGSFSMEATGLTHNTEYYIRAYASNNAGTGYGEPIPFRTLFQCGAQLLDVRDGQTYFTVSIGEQCWMAENLNAGVFVMASDPLTDDGTVQKYCYEDSDANCYEYGAQYTWDEMMQYTMVESAQGVCPSGWHIPSDFEWKTMERSLGMTVLESDGTLWRGTVEGGMLKSGGTTFWNPPNEGATNSTLFSALPAGMVWTDGSSSGMGDFAVFWTSTPILDTQAWYRYLHTDEARIYRVDGYRPNSTSVRCVKD